jgi:hypothetical protein
MVINNNLIEKIEIQWEVIDNNFSYMDTILMTKEEYEKTSKKKLEKQQLEKYNNWKTYMINPNL